MKSLKYFWPVLVEIVQVPLIIIMFKVLPYKKLAGLLGGVMFLLVIFALVNYFYKMLYKKSFAIYALLAHLFMFVIPILVFRIGFWSTPFEEIVFMGVPASLLHSLSEKFYVVVLWATIYDCMKIKQNEGRPYFDEEGVAIDYSAKAE